MWHSRLGCVFSEYTLDFPSPAQGPFKPLRPRIHPEYPSRRTLPHGPIFNFFSTVSRSWRIA